MESHAREMANARERINRAELALERTEEMLAENIALRSRIRAQRCLVEAAYGLAKIDPQQTQTAFRGPSRAFSRGR
ncbi:MAG: hypothetical protein EOR46_25935 [Mesorhizobium sp.]|nr:MAG: hypothetical protein EOR46_25935 [Mesorhizobium sp.]RWK66194.1 MAG: hypothetical protein EOR54_25780 [Mesorhizobium sp.]RWK68752.1 MAG: hypothetical protein EOR50_35255 [Mesorhizobium sp.]RWK75978.1 MAG: hypothetical protein EOR51_30170 [Mesorhizobium sp.]RWL00591.1 MAG: hypothetical protein EOR55_28315 [Mesorhizobium sp.]